MNERQLECFLKVAQTCNFRAAAEALYISQPALTKQVQSLEAELGTQLFDRDTAHVSLTESGSRFLPRARQLLELMRDTSETVQHNANRLTLNYFYASGLGDVVRDFHDSCPNTVLQLARMRPWESIGPLVKRPGNLVFAAREELSHLTGVVFIPICTARWHVAMAPDSPLATAASLQLADLDGQTILWPTPIAPERLATRLSLLMEELLPTSPFVSCSSVDEILTMAKAGAGIGLFLLPENGQLPGLAHPILSDQPTAELGFAYLTSNETPDLLSLSDVLQDVYGGGAAVVLQ